eukprot:6479455-Amphidinium_carterae.1
MKHEQQRGNRRYCKVWLKLHHVTMGCHQVVNVPSLLRNYSRLRYKRGTAELHNTLPMSSIVRKSCVTLPPRTAVPQKLSSRRSSPF